MPSIPFIGGANRYALLGRLRARGCGWAVAAYLTSAHSRGLHHGLRVAKAIFVGLIATHKKSRELCGGLIRLHTFNASRGQTRHRFVFSSGAAQLYLENSFHQSMGVAA